MSAKYDTDCPMLDVENLDNWDLRMNAYLRGKKQAHTALEQPKPKKDLQKLATLLGPLGEPTDASRAYESTVRRAKKSWKRKNDICYSALVQACARNAAATNLLMLNKKASAQKLRKLIKEKFDLSSVTTVVQAKIEEANGLLLQKGVESATDFCERITGAKITLHGLGQTHFDDDVFCLGRLRAGILHDPRYATLATTLTCMPNLTYDEACTIVRAFDKTLTKSKPTPEPEKQEDVVRLLKEKHKKHVKALHHKLKTRNIRCTYCRKPGHSVDDCKKLKAKKAKENAVGPVNTPSNRGCFLCDDPGHRQADCPHQAIVKQAIKKAKTSSGHSVTFDDEFDEYARMLSDSVPDGHETDTETGVVDSGSTTHLATEKTVEKHSKSHFNPTERLIYTAEKGAALPATGQGDLGALSDVLQLRDDHLSSNILSVPRFDLDGCKVVFENQEVRVYNKQRKLIASGPLGSDLSYRLLLKDVISGGAPEGGDRALLGSATPPEDLNLWHDRLIHRNRRQLTYAIKHNLIQGINIKGNINKPAALCEPCVLAKSTRRAFSHKPNRPAIKRDSLRPANSIIQRVVTDLKGPMSVTGMNGENYKQLITDADTKWREVYFVKTKDEADKNLYHYFDNTLAAEGLKCREYFTDNAPELISLVTLNFLNSKGCKLVMSAPYAPQENSVAESSNRVVWDAQYAALLNCSLPSEVWPLSTKYATMVLNFLPTDTAFGYMSPFQAKYKVVPNVKYFRRFGCICYVHVDKSQRKKTFDEKALKGYFVGIKDITMMNTYLVLVPSLNKIVESVHVLFDEISKPKRDHDDFLIIDEDRKVKEDFHYLIHMLFKDPDSDLLFVTTRIQVERSFIVAYRAPYIMGKIGKEESRPWHAREIENMLKEYLKNNEPQIVVNNELKTIPFANRNSTTATAEVNTTLTEVSAQGIDHPSGTSHHTNIVPALSTGKKRQSSVTETYSTTESSVGQDCSPSAVSRQSNPGRTDSTPIREGQRIRQPRELLNVSDFGNIKDKVCYIVARDIPLENEAHSRWNPSKIEELRSCIIDNNVWCLEPLPPDRKAISTKWVVKEKTFPTHRFKSRITPRGFSQKKGIDYKETFAPVARITTLRVFLSLVAILGLFTCQLDLKTAFLNAPLDEIIYCQPVHDQLPLTLELLKTVHVSPMRERIITQIKLLKKGYVLRMLKACYGLKQAPRQWWKQLNTFLTELGFKSIHSDICFYVLHLPGGAYVLLLLYVDDILLAATTSALVLKYASLIAKKFRVSNMGPLENYLNITLHHNRKERYISMNMAIFCEKAIKRFGITPKASVLTPLPENFNLTLEEEIKAGNSDIIDNFQYREKIGVILYFMLCMSPQLAYAISVLSRYCEKPNRVVCAAVTRVLQYMYNKRNLVLKLGGTNTEITAYFDADWAGDRLTRRSTSGYIMFLGFGPIDWGSKLQRIVATSTAEAETVASSEPCKAIVWLRWMLSQLKIASIKTAYSSTLFGDNMACIKIAENPVYHERTKHIAIKYFYGRDLEEAGVLSYNYVSSKRNISDMMTKALGNYLFTEHESRALGGAELEQPTKRRKTQSSDEFV